MRLYSSFVLLAFAIAQIGPADAITLGKAMDALCPAIKENLGNLTTFSTALSLIGSIDLPELASGEELVIMAPTDAAFTKALKSLGLKKSDIITNPFTAQHILKNHIAFAPSKAAKSISTLSGESLTFMTKNKKEKNAVILGNITAALANGSVSIMDANSTKIATVGAVVSCPDDSKSAFIIDTVLVPSAAAASLSSRQISLLRYLTVPAGAPSRAPIGAPSRAPSSSSSTNTAAIVGGVIGGIVVLAAIAALAIWLQRRSRRPQPLLPRPEDQIRYEAVTRPEDSIAFASSLPSLRNGSQIPAQFLVPEHPIRFESTTRPEESLTPSMASMPSLPASSDPVLQWVASRAAVSSQYKVVATQAADGGLPQYVKEFEFVWSDARVLKPLGTGSFGKVFLGTLKHTPVALKLLIDAKEVSQAATASAATFSASASSTVEVAMPSRAALMAEASILASLRHPNVALLMGYCMDPPCLALEYASRGSLFDLLKAAATDPAAAAELTWQRRLVMAADAARGMLHLHTRSSPILHRDLKSPNLLITSDWTVKVTDMGLSKVASEASRNASATNAGANNPRWLAPEVLEGCRATESSDVFSFGVVMWELLTWRLPWDDRNVWTIVGGVLRGDRLEVPLLEHLPGELPTKPALDAYVALMRRCWAQDPAQRPDFDAIAAQLRALGG